MHSLLYRLNAVLTFSVLALGAICFSASMTDLIHSANPSVDITIVKFEGLRRTYGGNDEAQMLLDIAADLTSLFTWNTKQLFVFVAAEYVTSKNSWNQISLWDKIVTAKKDAKFKLLTYNKYEMIDQGNDLRGLEFNLTMYWHVMPKTGRMFQGKRSITGFQFPSSYF